MRDTCEYLQNVSVQALSTILVASYYCSSIYSKGTTLAKLNRFCATSKYEMLKTLKITSLSVSTTFQGITCKEARFVAVCWADSGWLCFLLRQKAIVLQHERHHWYWCLFTWIMWCLCLSMWCKECVRGGGKKIILHWIEKYDYKPYQSQTHFKGRVW